MKHWPDPVPPRLKMLHASFNHPDTYRLLLSAPVWKEVFAWIESRDPDLPDGIHSIRGEEIFVNQHRYETLPREKCRWESHRRYIDLQFCLEGAEIIDVTNRDLLIDDGTYDEEKDLLFYHDRLANPIGRPQPAGYSPLLMAPGSIAIFTTTDAHRPKVAVTDPARILKFVVKISLDALGES